MLPPTKKSRSLVKARPDLAPEVRPELKYKNPPSKKSRAETKERSASKARPVSEQNKKSKNKQPSNNKRKTHNRINNNLETRRRFIREKLTKVPQKTILKKEGTAI